MTRLSDLSDECIIEGFTTLWLGPHSFMVLTRKGDRDVFLASFADSEGPEGVSYAIVVPNGSILPYHFTSNDNVMAILARSLHGIMQGG